MTTTLADQEARDRIREDLDTTLVVEAAAGTGKTTSLVARMVAILESGRAELPQMVALTFTEKAAGEMKLRLRAALESRRLAVTAGGAVAARLTSALAALETAQVGTIHGFCSDLLLRRPVEAGVDPAFSVGGGDEIQSLLERVFQRHLQEQLEAPPEGLRRALRRERERGSIVDELQRATATLVEQRDFPTPWARPALDRCRLIDDAYEELASLAALHTRAANTRDALCRDLAAIDEFVQEQRASEQALGGRDYDALEAALCGLQRRYIWRRKGSGVWFGKELRRKDVLEQRDRVYELLTRTARLLEADLAAALHADLQSFVSAYEQEKQRHGTLDYLDLLIRVRDLLRDNAAVRNELQAQYTHLFLDEFQDIDPLQAEIVAALCCDSASLIFGASTGPQVPAGKLFVVGDPKQAIYRFRRADVQLYERVKGALSAGGAAVLQLTTSFRSLPAIQSLVNEGFARHMVNTAEVRQASYAPLCAVRQQPDTQPAVIALPVPSGAQSFGRVARTADAERTADAIAALTELLIQHPEAIGRAADKPLRPSDFCLLFRRFRAFGREVTSPYLQALTARDIPHVLIGGRAFQKREEVLCLRTALQAIEWPDDELQVYATLRGPFIALRDEALFAYKQSCGPLSAGATAGCDARQEDEHQPVRQALDLLHQLHQQRNRRPISETLQAFLTATRAHAGLALWPRGDQVLANVARLVDLARRFERHGSGSLRGFCDWLEQSALRGEVRDASTSEDSAEGVRLMTVHNAKGLEFPVVILCDPTVPRSGGYPSRYLDHERRLWACSLLGCQPHELLDHTTAICAEDDAEEVRIAYVAATRAKDMLVVPVGDDEPIAGWLDVLHPGLYPLQGSSARPLAQPPAGLKAVAEAAEVPVAGPRPGYHQPAHGDHRVLFWDAATLRPPPPARAGVRQQELLMEDPHGNGERGLRAFEAWQDARAQALARGRSRSYESVAVTLAGQTTTTDQAPPTVVQLPVARGRRPRGARFGTLVHVVLADSQFVQDAVTLQRLSELHGRLLGAADDEITHAVHAALAALQHPLMAEAAASADARFEVPVLMQLRPQQLVEGVIDLLFTADQRPGSPLVIIDFKTDEVADQPQYRAQLGLYALSVTRATGRPTQTYLLGV